MAQVPYQPFITDRPQTQGERVSVSTPGEAFGTNIGQALQHLGVAEENVGSEVFSRAIAMQELNNETEARQKASDYAEKQAQLQADFDSLKGVDAKNALLPHLAASRQLRDQMRGSLTNPSAQRMFDSMSFGFLERNIFSSARHAGDEFKN